jgi:hypothetical protein
MIVAGCNVGHENARHKKRRFDISGRENIIAYIENWMNFRSKNYT